MNIDNNTKIFLGDREIVEVRRGGVTIWEKSSEPEVDYFYVENTYDGTNTLTLTTTSTGSPSTDTYSSTVEYSKDKTNWATVNFDTSTPYDITMNQGEKVYFRNDNGKFNYYPSYSRYYYTRITCSQTNNAGGNINSLLDYNNIDSVTLPIGAFYGLFKNNTKLVNATNLVLTHTVISESVLFSIFESCSSLTTPPNLSNLTSISSDGLYNAFSGCSSLTTPPDLSNVRTIGTQGLQYAFSGCTSLTTPPNLSNLTSINTSGLNNAFSGCSSLTTGPDLSNVRTISSYCLASAFSGCSKISTVTAPNVSNLKNNYVLSSWLTNAGTEVTGTKTVNVPTRATINTDSTSGIPTGWVRVNY